MRICCRQLYSNHHLNEVCDQFSGMLTYKNSFLSIPVGPIFQITSAWSIQAFKERQRKVNRSTNQGLTIDISSNSTRWLNLNRIFTTTHYKTIGAWNINSNFYFFLFYSPQVSMQHILSVGISLMNVLESLITRQI